MPRQIIERSMLPDIRPVMAQQHRRPTSPLVLALATLVMVEALATPVAAAVFGDDDRRKVPLSLIPLSENVGTLIDADGNRACTAFCVGSRTIATAAHCLVRQGEANLTRPQSFQFVLSHADASATADREVMTRLATPRDEERGVTIGSATLRLKPPIDSSGDWALAHLARPICAGGGLRLSTLSPAEVRGTYAARHAFNLAYHKDQPRAGILAGSDCALGMPVDGLPAHRIAREFSRPAELLLHTCDTAGGASGSPIIINGVFGPEVVGINVGTYVQSTQVTDTGERTPRSISGAVANTAASAAQIALALAEFDATEVISDKGSLAELSALLDGRGATDRDPSAEPSHALSAMIREYQLQSGLETTGIATRGLLQRLRDETLSPASSILMRHHPQETGATR